MTSFQIGSCGELYDTRGMILPPPDRYPARKPCPVCGETLGLNPEFNGYRQIFCYACDYTCEYPMAMNALEEAQ